MHATKNSQKPKKIAACHRNIAHKFCTSLLEWQSFPFNGCWTISLPQFQIFVENADGEKFGLIVCCLLVILILRWYSYVWNLNTGHLVSRWNGWNLNFWAINPFDCSLWLVNLLKQKLIWLLTYFEHYWEILNEFSKFWCSLTVKKRRKKWRKMKKIWKCHVFVI